MSGRVRIIASGLVAIAAVTVAGCGSEQASPETSVRASSTPTTAPPAATPPGTSQAAVPEQLKFTAKTLEGTEFSGASLAGKAAVLWFWAPWCPKCRGEAPSLAKTATANADVAFVGVASQDKLPAMKEFVQKYGVGGFTHLDDGDGTLWQRFGVTYQPAYAFVSPDGTVDVVKDQLSDTELADRVGELAGH